jgi:hypothetical protein
MSAYLRILAIQDRKNEEREELKRQMYPDRPRPLDTCLSLHAAEVEQR